MLFGQDLTPKQKKKKWGFVNSKNEWVIKPKFTEVKKFTEGLACVRIKKKWGFINAEGKKVIPFKYSAAQSFENGYASVRSLAPLAGNTRESNNQYKWGFINKSGQLIVSYLFKQVKSFDNKERALVQLFEMKNNEFFWINPNGKSISPPFIKKEKIGTNYKIENTRNDGLKVYRYIKPNGTPITEWYLNSFSLEDTLIKVWLPSKTTNDTIQEQAFKGNAKKKLCAYINKEGNVISGWYSEIKPFLKGHAPVRHHHLYGFIDSNFILIKKPTYRELSLLQKEIYKGQVEYGKTALLNYKGKELSSYCFDFEQYQDSLFLGKHQLKSSYRNEVKYAVFDRLGHQKTSWYNKINGIFNGIIRVEDERTSYETDRGLEYAYFYSYVNLKTGELITTWRPSLSTYWDKTKDKEDSILSYLYLTENVYHLEQDFFQTLFIKEFEYLKKEQTINFSGGDFHNGMALVAKKGKKITKEINGVLVTRNETLYGYIDWYGDLVIPYRYKEAAAFRDEYAVVSDGKKYGAISSKGKKVVSNSHLILGAYGSGLFPVVNEKGLWGYINRKNRMQIKPQFDNVMPFSYGYASIKKGRHWGLIDVMGNELMGFDYNKPIEILSPQKIKYLKSGVGYVELKISDLKK